MADQDKKEAPRRGGLGRGLAALIPTAPEGRPRMGDGAADEIFGPSRGGRTGGGSDKNRHRDVIAPPSTARDSDRDPAGSGRRDDVVSRETDRPAPRRSGARRAESGGVGATYRELPVPVIIPNPRQPRHVFDEEPLQELAHSIREFGLMQPIVVRAINRADRPAALERARETNPEAPQPEFEIIMGERRWRAAQLAGLDVLPTIVRDTDDTAMLRDALLENIHRVQLNPLEEAAAYQQLLEEFDVTQAQLAERIGRSRPVITNMIRLLGLPVEVQRRVAAGVLSAGHARALLGVKTEEKTADQQRLAERIVTEGLSVRATEEAVTLLNRGDAKAAGRKPRIAPPQPEQLTTWADRLADDFDTKVTATMGKRKGKIVIEFGDLDDFDRIMHIIRPDGD
ncbi:ParB/RepB/Spo0J family partition protein [Corynebacterium sp. 335C]